MNLQRGMRDKLDKYLNTSQPIDVTMDVQGKAIYDFCCFGVDAAGKLSDDEYMVFYNQTSSPKNEIVYSLNGRAATFAVNLSKLPSTIQKLVFTVSIDGSGTMGDISSHTVKVRQGYGEYLELKLSGSDFRKERAIIAIEIYRKDVWRIAAVANGFNGGLGDLLRYYGGKELPVKPNKDGKLLDSLKAEVSDVVSVLPKTEAIPGPGLKPTPSGQKDNQRRTDSQEALKMIYKATKLIQSDFKTAGIKCNSRELGNFSMVEAGFTGKNCTVMIRFISVDDGNGVKALTENFAKFSRQRLSAGYEVVNGLNQKYKYAKFTMTKDGEICADYDFPVTIKDDEVGKVAVEIVLRFAQIVDEAYPEIMKNAYK